jgi:hypothetical protein
VGNWEWEWEWEWEWVQEDKKNFQPLPLYMSFRLPLPPLLPCSPSSLLPLL